MNLTIWKEDAAAEDDEDNDDDEDDEDEEMRSLCDPSCEAHFSFSFAVARLVGWGNCKLPLGLGFDPGFGSPVGEGGA